MNVRRSTLVGAAVLAGAVGIGLVILGWWAQGWQHHDGWDRYTDLSWWTGGLVRGLGILMLGKLGFKVALAGIVASLAAFAWYRNNQPDKKTPPQPVDAAPHADDIAEQAGEPAPQTGAPAER
jgi:hypothetical protein